MTRDTPVAEDVDDTAPLVDFLQRSCVGKAQLSEMEEQGLHQEKPLGSQGDPSVIQVAPGMPRTPRAPRASGLPRLPSDPSDLVQYYLGVTYSYSSHPQECPRSSLRSVQECPRLPLRSVQECPRSSLRSVQECPRLSLRSLSGVS